MVYIIRVYIMMQPQRHLRLVQLKCQAIHLVPNKEIIRSINQFFCSYMYIFIDAIQFADACGADLTNTTMVKTFSDVVSDTNLATFQGIILIMPAAILAFVALFCKFLILAQYI